MHMGNELLHPAVGVAMYAVSAGALLSAGVRTLRDRPTAKTLLLAGTAGGFVFAAQALNLTIPGTGSSGHLLGGVLLSALLGGPLASLVMAAVLVLQCVLLGDGGVLALGCNLFNMAVLPCLILTPLCSRMFSSSSSSAQAFISSSSSSSSAQAFDSSSSSSSQAFDSSSGSSSSSSSFFSRLRLQPLVLSMVSMQLGAFCVVLQTQLSGVTALSFGVFLWRMLAIHLPISLVEGLVTVLLLLLFEKLQHSSPSRSLSQPRTALALLVGTALCAILLFTPLASQLPDGLEWSLLSFF